MARSWMERRRRASARIALYGSLLLLAAAALGLSAYLGTIRLPQAVSRDWEGVDFASMPEVRILADYLRIDTSQPEADEAAGALYLATHLRAAGIPTTVELLGGGHANLWAVLEGEDPEALVLHSHIDTDPVTLRDRWRHPPHSGAIDGPWLYGRGAYDMKSTAIAQLLTVLELKRRGRPPRRSVIFLATGSEEVGSDFGMKWILAHHPELADRFWAMLTEGGVVETRAVGEEDLVKYWGIEFSQKRYVDVTVCSPSRERLEILREELVEEWQDGNFEVRVTPEVETFLATYAPTRDRPELRQWLADLQSLRLDAVRFLRLGQFLKALFRDEAPPLEIQEDPGGGYRMLVKLHLLHGSDFEAARARLLPPWRTWGMSVEVHDEGGADRGSPLDHPVYRTLAELVAAEHPGVPVGPLFLPWTATDSRFVRAAGIPSYGFSPFVVQTPETLRIGRINERIRLPAYLDGVRLYRRVVERLVD